jgi:hypothetical protein
MNTDTTTDVAMSMDKDMDTDMHAHGHGDGHEIGVDNTAPPKPLTRYLNTFLFGLKSRRSVRCLIDSPLLFISESRYSPYNLVCRFMNTASHLW